MNKEIEKAAYKFAESQNDGNAFTAYYKGFISGAQFKENTDNVSLNKNTIPPMTNSLGKHWVQPDPSGFVLDDDYVLMSKLDFIKAVIADDRGGNSDAIAKYAVNCADALIKRLKEVNNG